MARYLPDVCNGDLTMTLAFLEDSIGWGPNEITLAMKKDGDAYVLNGIKRFVSFGYTADVILVVARSGGGSGADGVSLIAVPRDAAGLHIDRDVISDLTEKSATLHFDNVRIPAENLLGNEGGAWPAVQTTLQRAAIGASAEMLGASRKSLEMSTDYAKVRKQFGQFI